jgi:hypothetical protein
MGYRLEVKKAVRRVKKIATVFIFEAAVSLEAAQRRLVDDLLAVDTGRKVRFLLRHWRAEGFGDLTRTPGSAGPNAHAGSKCNILDANLASVRAL